MTIDGQRTDEDEVIGIAYWSLNPLIATLKLQCNGPSYSNTNIACTNFVLFDVPL